MTGRTTSESRWKNADDRGLVVVVCVETICSRRRTDTSDCTDLLFHIADIVQASGQI